MKRSYQTGEYWLSVAAVVIGAVVSSGILDLYPESPVVKVVALLTSLLGALGYTVPRIALKQTIAKGEVLSALQPVAGVPANDPTQPPA